MPQDPDRLIADGEIPGDAVAALEREFFEALKHDPEMLIELAEAASAVAAGRKPPMPHAVKMRRADARAAARGTTM